MIESLMYFGIGFLFATLVALAVIPLVHSRAVRLTMRRLEASIPQSLAEIQADKDALRAEFAMSTRRLESTIDELKNKHTNQLAEIGRKGDAVNRLKIEREAQKVEVVALKAELDTLKVRSTALDKRIGATRDRHHADDRVSLVPKEWPAGEEPLVAQAEPDSSPESLAAIPLIHASPRIADHHFVTEGPSIGRRISRGLSHFIIAALIGAGAAFAWQSRTDGAKEMVRAWAPPVGRLLFAEPTKPPSVVIAERPDPAPAQDPASSPSAAVTQTPAVPAAPAPPEVAQEAENALERDLPPVQNNEEQVAAKQEQGGQNIATLPAEQSIKQEMPSPATPDQPTPALAPETRPTIIANWTLREVTNGTAVLQGPTGVWRVMRDDAVPGLGKVTSIVRWGNGWVVVTSVGYCTSAPTDRAVGVCKPYRGD